MSLCGAGDDYTTFPQDAHILLRGGSAIHPAIHGRGHEQRAFRGERGNRQQRIRQAVRQLRQRIGSAGRDDQYIGLMCQPDMQDMRLPAPQVGVCIGFAACHGLERQCADEFLGAGSQDDIHLGAGLGQFGGQISRLIGGNRTGHTQQDMFVIQHGHIR